MDLSTWKSERDGKRAIVHVTGEIDLETGPRLREFLTSELNQLSAPSGELVLDLTAVTFCDSSGLQALIATLRRARLLGVRLVLRVIPDSRFARFLALAGVSELFELEDGTAQA
ncbi:STAS domain-containing protein [Motilibacter aurantiacus]|uniref:STAS domain-containing protein n=1 Tax=Motilibacter aurantiacus TaxID=2714955 RepID=UPI00140BEFE9|nr:STAS domain-containing protein [Motilibacter aurantiacus]